MIAAVILRASLVMAFMFALLSLWVHGALIGAIVLTALAFLLCRHHQRAVWNDGWEAAHEHHKIGDGQEHLREYTSYLAGQGV